MYHCRYFGWLMLGVSLIFHPNTRAGSVQDRNCVINTYNTNTDPCYKLSTHSQPDVKDTANRNCLRAFEALDRIDGNSCTEWRRPKCRQLQLPDSDHFQCSCRTASSVFIDLTHEVIAFRDCAWKLFVGEILDGQAPVPSANYQREHQKIYDKAVQKSRRRCYKGSSSKRPVSPIADPAGILSLYVCSACTAQFPSKKDFIDHAKNHIGQWCGFCERTYSTRGNYYAHKRKQHPNLAEAGPSGLGGPHKCEVCGKGYKTRHGMTAHRRTHTENVRCSVCGGEHSTVTNYRVHMRQYHPEIAATEAAEAEAQRLIQKPFACETCTVRFTTRKRLNEHYAVHRGETQCEHCDRIFPRKTLLNMHKRNDHPQHN